MQIFELTQNPINEIDYSKASGSGSGSSGFGNFLRGLGSTVGIKSPEPDPEDPKKLLSQQIQDAERYFDVAVDMLERKYPETTVIARLTNRYGATKQQAINAIESAVDYIEKENKDRESVVPQAQPQTPPIADPFDTMTHQLGQLGKRQANPGRVVKPAVQPPIPTAAQTDAKNKIAAAMKNYDFSDAEIKSTLKTLPPNIGNTDADIAAAMKQIFQAYRKPVAESLTWSRGFDPSVTLLKKIRQL